MSTPSNQEAFHLMAKPCGPTCNLRCRYCYYIEKTALFDPSAPGKMSAAVLEMYIRKYLEAHPGPEVIFAWQGGEPTLCGLDFFRNVVQLQQRWSNGKIVSNSLQTNGTLLDDEQCAFFAEHQFLVGLSLDGPPRLHDGNRKTRAGSNTSRAVLRGLKLLQKHQVEFNVLACVSAQNQAHPREVYNFLRDNGVRFIQFIPVVERPPDPRARAAGFSLSFPPAGDDAGDAQVTPWAVQPEAYGAFLVEVFEEWRRADIGAIFVMNFEWAFAAAHGMPSGVCQFSRRCGLALVVEHNGDIFACDHYVYPPYRVGNILTDELPELLASPPVKIFGAQKELHLPTTCLECFVLRYCWGDCPKHRFVLLEGEPHPMSYLCRAYKRFFGHVQLAAKTIFPARHLNIP